MNFQVLSINQVSKKFTQLFIFDQTSYDFSSDCSYALMGPSGIGKSTMMAMMAGIDHPTHGTIALNGVVISHQTFERRIALLQNQIGIVFQQPCLIAELTVLENVMLKCIIQETITEQFKIHALNLLLQVGLIDKAFSFPHTLSGGQQQKIAILRAIFYAPKFLLVDEPTANLDKKSAEQIIALLLEYQKRYTMGLIMSTHDSFVAKQCDRVLQIENQKLVELVRMPVKML